MLFLPISTFLLFLYKTIIEGISLNLQNSMNLFEEFECGSWESDNEFTCFSNLFLVFSVYFFFFTTLKWRMKCYVTQVVSGFKLTNYKVYKIATMKKHIFQKRTKNCKKLIISEKHRFHSKWAFLLFLTKACLLTNLLSNEF